MPSRSLALSGLLAALAACTPKANVLFTVTVSGTNVSVTPAGSVKVASGQKQAFSVSPEMGYVLGAVVGGTCPAGSWSGTTYTTGEVTADCSVSFSALLKTFTVTASGTNVSILPSGPQTVAYGGNQAFTVTANSGAALSMQVGGTCPAGSWAGAIYTTGAILADCSVTFSATAGVTWQVTPSGDGNETITPSTVQTVDAGATTSFTVVASGSFMVSSTVNGTCPAGSWNETVYTTGAIVADCTVFFTATPLTYTVTPSGDGGETITPGTPQTVASGATRSFTVTANAGYTLSGSVAGTCPGGTWAGSVYTTGAITGNCTVTFAATPITYTVTPSGDGNETISPDTPLIVSYGSTQAFQVDPTTGYTVSAAVAGSCPAGTWSADVYTTGVITSNCTVSFSAAPISYTVSASGDGLETITPNTVQTVASGSTQAFQVDPRPDYTVSSTVGGTCPAGTWSADVYSTGAIISNCTVTFSAALSSYTVTPAGDGWETITPGTPQSVVYGSTQAFQVDPLDGYTVMQAVRGTCPAGTWTADVYTTGPITAGCTVAFSATLNTYTVTPSGNTGATISPDVPQMVGYGSTESFQVDPTVGDMILTSVAGTCPAGSWNADIYTTGAIVADCTVVFSAAAEMFQVTPSGDGNEAIAPGGSQIAAWGTRQSFQVDGNPGYTVSQMVGGTCPAGSWSGDAYTTGPITGSCTVTFSATLNSYSVVPTGDGSETINPSTAQTVFYGSTQSFQVDPMTGYTLFATTGGTCPAGSWSGDVYTTGVITSNCSVSFSAAVTTFQVTPSGDGNEAIAPATPQTVAYGNTESFQVDPIGAYTVSQTVGGTCPSGSWSGDAYTTGVIMADCTVIFSATPITYTATPSGDSHVTVLPGTAVTVDSGAAATFEVDPVTGFTVQTSVGGTCPVGSWSGDQYTTGPITADCTVAFSATLTTYEVTASGDGGETIGPATTRTIAYDMTASFQVDADMGETLSMTVGGTCPAGSWSGDMYTTGVITADCSVSFSATVNTYVVTPSGDGEETIAPAAPQTVSYAMVQSFQVDASPGYTVLSVVGGDCPVGTWSGDVYTTGAITADCAVAFSAAQATFQVSVSGDSWETITPDDTVTVAGGTGQSFHVDPITGYAVNQSVGGTCPAGTWNGDMYTTGSITADCSVAFTASVATFQVTPSGDGGELITPGMPQTVTYGGTQTFQVDAALGYTVNAPVGGSCPQGTWSGDMYTTGMITADCSVSFSGTIMTFVVTPSGDAYESVQPATAQTVDYGVAATFQVDPLSGYTVSATVGGTCPPGSWSDDVYSTGVITSDCSVAFSGGFLVTATVDSNESTSPQTQVASPGSGAAFTLTPQPGDAVSYVPGGTCPAGTWSGDVYTTGAITAGCEVDFTGQPRFLQTLAWLGRSFSPSGTVSSSNVAGATDTREFVFGDPSASNSGLPYAWFTTPSQTGVLTYAWDFTGIANTEFLLALDEGAANEEIDLETASPGGAFHLSGTSQIGVESGSPIAFYVNAGGTVVSGTLLISTISLQPGFYVTISSDGNERISNSVELIASGGTATVQVDANTGYTLSQTVGGSCPAGSWNGDMYTTGPITVGCTLTFSAPVNTYQVGASGDGNETIAAPTTRTINYGLTATLQVDPNTGYMVDTVVGGSCPVGSWNGDLYSTGTIAADCSVAFSATPITYQVTASGDSFETIAMPTTEDVTYNLAATFQVDPNSGYTVVTAVGGTCPAGSWTSDFYTTGPVAGDCSVTFSATTSPAQVSVSGDGNETIAPDVTQIVAVGSTQSYTVTADAAFTVSHSVGGTCPQGSWTGSVYTTGTIAGDCSLSFSAQ